MLGLKLNHVSKRGHMSVAHRTSKPTMSCSSMGISDGEKTACRLLWRRFIRETVATWFATVIMVANVLRLPVFYCHNLIWLQNFTSWNNILTITITPLSLIHNKLIIPFPSAAEIQQLNSLGIWFIRLHNIICSRSVVYLRLSGFH